MHAAFLFGAADETGRLARRRGLPIERRARRLWSACMHPFRASSGCGPGLPTTPHAPEATPSAARPCQYRVQWWPTSPEACARQRVGRIREAIANLLWRLLV